jgi:hypothetical protein
MRSTKLSPEDSLAFPAEGTGAAMDWSWRWIIRYLNTSEISSCSLSVSGEGETDESTCSALPMPCLKLPESIISMRKGKEIAIYLGVKMAKVERKEALLA